VTTSILSVLLTNSDVNGMVITDAIRTVRVD
jgi:hypothetical protein